MRKSIYEDVLLNLSGFQLDMSDYVPSMLPRVNTLLHFKLQIM